MMGNSLEGDLGLAAWDGLLSRRGRHSYSVLHRSTKIVILGMASPIGRPAKCTRLHNSAQHYIYLDTARVLKQCQNRRLAILHSSWRKNIIIFLQNIHIFA